MGGWVVGIVGFVMIEKDSLGCMVRILVELSSLLMSYATRFLMVN